MRKTERVSMKSGGAEERVIRHEATSLCLEKLRRANYILQ
jgi:hypothetical protein